MALDTAKFDRIRVAAAGSDEDVINFGRAFEGGIDGLLDEVFGNLPQAFRPERAAGQQADFQYRIDTPDGVREFFVSVDGGKAITGRGVVESPRLTMSVNLPTFMRLVSGRLNGMQAFLRGKVKLSGNTLYAAKFEHWFERPTA
ncbi:MAG TPA: SCP2 sterol-binding domain-containing protein [Kineosporiaceae bacterium]|nr:SCP2 sterol-binding domain-containing protein [Kineosporiaceae bacterium]